MADIEIVVGGRPLPIGGRRLSPARRGVESPLIVPGIRADIPDYGNPGAHFHGPLARQKLNLRSGGGAFRGELPLEEEPTGLAACFPAGGTHVWFNGNAGAGVTVGRASALIVRPYLIAQIRVASDSVIQNLVFLRIKVADDNDVSAGEASSGEDIEMGMIVQRTFEVSNSIGEIWPMYRVARPRTFIKIFIINTSIATVNFQGNVSLWFAD